MSNDDVKQPGPMEPNPLEADLLEALGPPQPAAPVEGLEALAASEAPQGESAPEQPPAPEEAAPEPAQPKPPTFWSKLAQSDPYNVMLVVSAVALLIGILCLLLEWGSYGFDTKASEARTSARAAAPRDPGTV